MSSPQSDPLSGQQLDLNSGIYYQPDGAPSQGTQILIFRLKMVEGRKKVAIVGAGLVGSLEACYLAQRGYEVHLYEYREDIRNMEHVPGRSINLAMSVRQGKVSH